MMVISRHINSLLAGRSGAAAISQTLIAKILVLVIQLGTGMLTARLLGNVGRGEQAALMLWPGFLASIMTFGIPSALMYRMKQRPDRQAELFTVAIGLIGLVSLLGIVIGWVGVPFWMAKYSPEMVRAAQLFMLTMPFGLSSALLLAAFQAREEFTLFNKANLIIPFGTLLLLLGLWKINYLNPISSAVAYSLPGFPITAWMLIQSRKLITFQIPRFRQVLLSIVPYGLSCYAVEILGAISLQIDQAIVISLLNASEMGVYVIALSLSRMLSMFHSSVTTVLLPKATALSKPEVVAMVGKAARVNALLTSLVAIPMLYFGSHIIALLYGQDFMAAVLPMQILLCEVVIGSIVWVLAQAFLAVGKPGVITAFQGLGLLVSVPCMLFLIPRYGIVGAAMSMLISASMKLVFVQCSFPVILGIQPPSLVLSLLDLSELKLLFAKGFG
jgi:enterobacterial common antigen flippase